VSRTLWALAVALLLAGHAALSTWSSWNECAAFDEGIHLGAGIAAWRTGEHRLSPEHPPLLRLIAAIPSVLAGVRFDASDPRYLAAEEGPTGAALLYEWNDERSLLRPARLALLALTLLGGLAIAVVARWLYGDAASLLAAALFALSPEFLAHGHYVATDAGVAVLLFGATAAWWAFRARSTRARFAVAAILSGLSLSAKFSALLLPAWVLPLFAVDALRRDDGRGRALARVAVGAAVAAAIAILAAGAVYGFRFVDLFAGARLRLENLDDQWTYLLGRGSTNGFLAYFPVTFAAKTPLPLLALVVVAGSLAIARAKRGADREIALLLPVVVYGAAAIASRFDIGHRHLLPIYPFLFVFAAKLVEGNALERARWRGALAALAIVLHAATTLRAAPHFLSYVNEAAGGPRAGPWLFGDATIDWGQDLPSLKRWMDAHGVARVRLGYIGAGSPSYEGIDCEVLPGRGRPMTPTRDVPAAREFAPLRDGEWIAVNVLALRDGRNDEERRFWRFLDDRRPDAQAANVFLLYRADADLAERGNAALARLRSDRNQRR
jgi:dolichyl-phosphate-mannose-protein mannosyltransferase